MKKIKHILVCGLAVVASAVAVQAQTLTQDWKMTTGLPSAAKLEMVLEEKEKSGLMTRVLQN